MRYRDHAKAALKRAHAVEAGAGNTPYGYAAIARTYFELDGWSPSNDKGMSYLRKALSLRNSNGGWGLGREFDAFSDGSINPATTSYTVTAGDHLGPVLILAHKHGLIGEEELSRTVTSLLSTPVATMNDLDEKCISYSTSDHDTPSPPNGKCVNNVNASAGWLLIAAADAGVEHPRQRDLAKSLLAYDWSQRTVDGGWPYFANGTTHQDLDHNALNVEVHHRVGTPGSHHAIKAALRKRHGKHPMDRMSYLRLVAVAPETCKTAEEHAAWMRNNIDESIAPEPTPTKTLRWSQLAMYTARAANACSSR